MNLAKRLLEALTVLSAFAGAVGLALFMLVLLDPLAFESNPHPDRALARVFAFCASPWALCALAVWARAALAARAHALTLSKPAQHEALYRSAALEHACGQSR